jgi:hypothetical protein
MTDRDQDFQTICRDINSLLQQYASLLTSDAIANVQHYVDHDEYEMAFEGLCLELLDRDFEGVDWDKCRDIARALDLDQESFFDPSFWDRISAK